MPYPESCPECGGTFRNTGTHFTARRNEVGRRVLLELGCQNTSRRFWWDFTMGQPSDVSRVQPQSRAAEPRELAAAASQASANGNAPGKSSNDNGHVSLVSLAASTEPAAVEADSVEAPAQVASAVIEPAAAGSSSLPESASLKDAFIRQLQLDRLTLRQMRNWVMADEARRAAEVAASATEATYERLALILFGLDLPELLGRAVPPPSTGMSAEERLEVQREKARIRARQRRAAIKAARLAEHAS